MKCQLSSPDPNITPISSSTNIDTGVDTSSDDDTADDTSSDTDNPGDTDSVHETNPPSFSDMKAVFFANSVPVGAPLIAPIDDITYLWGDIDFPDENTTFTLGDGVQKYTIAH